MVLNSLACIANYTYFKDENNVFLQNLEFIKTVSAVIITDNDEITTQGLRIICNISNTSHGKKYLLEDLSLEMLFTMLEHSARDAVYYAACTILNISYLMEMSDVECLERVERDWEDDAEISALIQLLIENFSMLGTEPHI